MTFTATACRLSPGDNWWAALCLLIGILCANRVLRIINRLRRRIKYLISATIGGDFSYKFPTVGVPEHERDINVALNRVVAHLEVLSNDARQNEAFLSLVIDLVNIGIAVINEKGHVVHSNKAVLSLLSLPVLTDVRQMPEDVSGLSITKTPALLHGKQMMIYTVTDMRRSLQVAEVESWEKLTRVLTHEIMNSLTPINSIADSLRTQTSADFDAASLRQQLAVISSSSKALMDFVKNFRKFSSLPPSNPKIFYIKPFVERAVALMAANGIAREIEFRSMVFPPDAMVYTDESLLNQVLVNILKNAVEANPSVIEVEAKIREDESVEISVANDGELIPSDLAAQIFTPFFTTKAAGSGIGLSLSRRIIARLGGTLTLATSPHTRFTVTLM